MMLTWKPCAVYFISYMVTNFIIQRADDDENKWNDQKGN